MSVFSSFMSKEALVSCIRERGCHVYGTGARRHHITAFIALYHGLDVECWCFHEASVVSLALSLRSRIAMPES